MRSLQFIIKTYLNHEEKAESLVDERWREWEGWKVGNAQNYMLRNLNILTLDKTHKVNVKEIKSNKRAGTYHTKNTQDVYMMISSSSITSHLSQRNHSQ